MPFRIIRNDITKVEADAIVNTANPDPIYGDGVDHAVYKAAGEKSLLAERKKIGQMELGDVAVTPGLKLPAKYIIHVVGPVWEGGDKGEKEILEQCYKKCLEKAEELGCKSIAFPLISTGSYGVPKDIGLQVAMNVLQTYAMHHNTDVSLVTFDRKSSDLSEQIFEKIDKYVDDHYVDEASAEYYEAIEQSEEQEVRLRRNRRMYERRREERLHLSNRPEPSVFEDTALPITPVANKIGSDEFEDQIEEEDKTFQEKFFEYLDKLDMKDSEFYKPLEIKKAHFSKIRGDRFYQPSRGTAMVLCLALKLDLAQAEDLLSRAGFVFNPTKRVDLVVKACIINHQYDVRAIEEYLESKDLPLLLKYT